MLIMCGTRPWQLYRITTGLTLRSAADYDCRSTTDHCACAPDFVDQRGAVHRLRAGATRLLPARSADGRARLVDVRLAGQCAIDPIGGPEIANG